MKKTLLISLALLSLGPLAAPAGAAYNVLLAGGSESNTIHIWLSPDGREYVIDSIVPLEVGGSVCAHATGNPNEIVCPAPRIASFEVNADGGDDKISVSRDISLPVTLRGGSGNDTLSGARGSDKLIGGLGDDLLGGGGGSDVLVGGPGADSLVAGPGDDMLVTGQGKDALKPGTGEDRVRKRPGSGPAPGTTSG
jgi:Ca2+-binding RTX toxin-like protein